MLICFFFNSKGYRPRPGYDYRNPYSSGNIGYPGYQNRPGYSQYRPGYDRPSSGNGNYFGGYGDGYSDNFRLVGRKVGETKKQDSEE